MNPAERFNSDGIFIPARNSRLRSGNKTGFRGVTRNYQTGKYRATLTFRGKRIYLGEYGRLEDAVAARRIGEDRYFKLYLEKARGK
ncbi:AP2 domain-containing protein [Sporolactobacillus vineae]|uniref:AP2 domain-containing protein n=1 Tax=Sporolactobacillus vineae TaxID=444463 RepID=UPI000289EEF5|nr:AP2 domain-containing protein [Sporolactobacillus vineae]